MNFVQCIKKWIGRKKTGYLVKKYADIFFTGKSTEKQTHVASMTGFYEIDKPKKTPFSVIIFATYEYKNCDYIKTYKFFLKKNVQIIVITDKKTYKTLDRDFVKKIMQNPGSEILISGKILKHTLAIALERCFNDYVLFTTATTVFSKTIIEDFESLSHENYPVYANENLFAIERFDMKNLAGTFFKRKFILKIIHKLAFGRRFFLGIAIKNAINPSDIYSYSENLVRVFPTEKYDLELFAEIAREIDRKIANGYVCDGLEELIVATENIFHEKHLTKLHAFLISATCAFILANHEIEKESYKQRLNSAMNFGHVLDENYIASLFENNFSVFLEKMTEKYDILCIENYGMDDIKNSRILDDLKEKYNVKYVKKRTSFEYYAFNNMILKLYSGISRLILSSGSLNKTMVLPDSKILTLWHGLGLLKETVVQSKKFTVGTIICSSEDCVPYYTRHFAANNALPLGSIQTDILFNEEYVHETRKNVRKELGIPEDAKLVFFAPTFRIAEDQYYDFGMDIDEFARELEGTNIYVIAKKHYIFGEIRKRTHKDMSGLYDSENMLFRVDEMHSFTELVIACDIFMTDYSSGLFYAVVLNKPLVLYAPDVRDYEKGKNGFILPYPDSIPGMAVCTASANALVFALKNPDSPKLAKYQEYKRMQVGACDGHVKTRILQKIHELLV